MDSILGQTHGTLEVLLVDDGSTDESGMLAEAYMQQDSRVTVLHQPNAGVSAARNAGLRAATGEYILFVDGDDFLIPEAVTLLLAGMTDDIDFVLGKRLDETWRVDSGALHGLSAPAQYALLSRHSGACLWQVFRGLYRREFLLNNSLFFDPSLCLAEDLGWMLRVVHGARAMGFVDVSFYGYRQRANSLSSAKSPAALLGALQVLAEIPLQFPQEAFLRDTADAMITSLCLLLEATLALTPEDRGAVFATAEKALALLPYASGAKQRLARLLIQLLGVAPAAWLIHATRVVRKKAVDNSGGVLYI